MSDPDPQSYGRSRALVVASIAALVLSYAVALALTGNFGPKPQAGAPHAGGPDAVDPGPAAGTQPPVDADHPPREAQDRETTIHDARNHAAAEHPKPPAPAVASVLPFAALLGAIALLPLIHKTSHWWEHNRNKFLVAASLGTVTLIYYAAAYGHGVHDHLGERVSDPGFPAAVAVFKNAILSDFVPFMTLLFCLYVISGGVSIEGNLVGTPGLNTRILAIGALLASFIGTTGAAMLLIRPLIRANARRRHVVHTVVFFIFIVCNIGGCLLPLGDPPLFLGYLNGVPFLWTLHLWKAWLVANAVLLGVYFAWDSWRFRGENEFLNGPQDEPRPFRIRGAVNFVWLAGVIAAVALLDPHKPVPGAAWTPPVYFREALMLSLAALSLATTGLDVRAANHFQYGAILEVAALFCGIFVCMQAPIQILNVRGGELGIDRPWEYFWGSGSLSSFLDNAPTYVVFFETAKAAGGGANPVQPVGVDFLSLVAISLGSVFMGANTYIGNGPNFMVKAIAEANNIRMPSFFGYMAYSGAILIPLFALITALFFAG